MPRSVFALILCTVGTVLLAASLPAQLAAAEIASPEPGDFVTVQLRDGRRVAGWVAPPTRPEMLSVRVGGPGLWLTSHFPWALVESVATQPPPPLPEPPESQPIGGPCPGPPGGVRLPIPLPRPPLLPMPSLPPRTIRLHAGPVNTDGDAAADSLRVIVLPLDQRGRPTAAGGQLNVSLIDTTIDATNGEPPSFRADWSRDLSATDFTPNGYVVDLPLRRALPASTVAQPRVFRVEASLSVPGTGRLEAAQSLLPHVPPSLGILRDRIVTP